MVSAVRSEHGDPIQTATCIQRLIGLKNPTAEQTAGLWILGLALHDLHVLAAAHSKQE